jgi:hypothetical protein
MNKTGTPILWPVRVWLAIEVLFSLGAILTTLIDPASTAQRFAWDVQPTVMAAVLGAYYLSTLPLTLLTLFARRWEMIRVIVLPTVLFTAVALLATLMHWSRFSVGSTPFTVWFLSYILPPPILLAGYLWQERRARKAGVVVPTDPLPKEVRLGLLHWGGLVCLLAVAIFIVPALAIRLAPWTLTPLTTRVLAALLLAAGGLMLSMARENDRSRVLFGVPMLLLMFPLVTLQIARFADQVNFSSVFLFIIYGAMLVAFALGVYLVSGNWRRAFG